MFRLVYIRMGFYLLVSAYICLYLFYLFIFVCICLCLFILVCICFICNVPLFFMIKICPLVGISISVCLYMFAFVLFVLLVLLVSFVLYFLHRIKMCPWIAEGCCRHGDLCNYAHTPEQLRPWLPLYKTKLCDAFKRVSGSNNPFLCLLVCSVSLLPASAEPPGRQRGRKENIHHKFWGHIQFRCMHTWFGCMGT